MTKLIGAFRVLQNEPKRLIVIYNFLSLFYRKQYKTYLGLHVNCLILSDFNKIRIFQQIFVEVPNIKFNGNPSSASGADICGAMDGRTDRWTDGRT
jgi:hypothetical protein